LSILILRKISLSFNGLSILKNINLEVDEGEVKLITGPSGSGKTTLLRVIAGVIPDIIKANLRGHIDPPLKDRRKIVGYITQEPWFSIATPYTWSEVASFSKDLSLEKIRNLLGKVGLDQHFMRTTFTLSAGETQRLAVASILASNKKVILLDEPASHLDSYNALRIKQTIEEMKEEGVSFLIVDHSLSLWEDIADRVYYLNKGELQEIPV